MSESASERESESARKRISESANQRGSESANRRGGGLPEGWVWATIGKITRPVEKVKPEEEPEVHFTYLDISSINNKSHRITEPKVYKGAEAPSRARQLIKANDVLFSTVRTYLKNIALVPEVYDGEIASTGFSVLRSKPGILPKYLFYYSLTDAFVSELSNLQRGTSYPAVRDDDVRTRLIPLAPLPEQHRIVDAIETQFTRLDAAVAALERVRANLGHYRTSVLQAACEGRLVPTEAELARRRRGGGEAAGGYESADVLLARILAERRARWEEERWESEIERAKKKAAQAERKAAGLPHYVRDLEPEDWEDRTPKEYERYLPKSDGWKGGYDEPQPPDTEGLPELPEGWVWASLDQLTCHITSGSRGWAKYYSDQGPIFIRAQDINTDELLLENVARVDLPESVEGDRARVVKDDLLVTITGANVTKTALVRQRIAEAYVSQHVGLVRPIMGRTSQYLYQWIISPVHGRRTLERNAYGAGKPGLNLTNLRELSIALPPLAEQRRIVEEVERRLSVVQVLEQSIEANLTRAERLRQAILKKAFEGRLVDQDPDDEPASVLLARVKAQREM